MRWIEPLIWYDDPSLNHWKNTLPVIDFLLACMQWTSLYNSQCAWHGVWLCHSSTHTATEGHAFIFTKYSANTFCTPHRSHIKWHSTLTGGSLDVCYINANGRHGFKQWNEKARQTHTHWWAQILMVWNKFNFFTCILCLCMCTNSDINRKGASERQYAFRWLQQLQCRINFDIFERSLQAGTVVEQKIVSLPPKEQNKNSPHFLLLASGIR